MGSGNGGEDAQVGGLLGLLVAYGTTRRAGGLSRRFTQGHYIGHLVSYVFLSAFRAVFTEALSIAVAVLQLRQPDSVGDEFWHGTKPFPRGT